MDGNMTTSEPPSSTTPANIGPYLLKHFYILIIGGFLILAFLGLFIYLMCRCRRRSAYGYTALREELSMPVKEELEKKRQLDDIRDFALLSCSFYMRNSGKYSLVDHLTEIGSRFNKQWFLVKAQESGEDLLLTMMNKSDPITVPFNNSSRTILLELFALMQHPYICPILDVDFVYTQEQIVIVQHFNKSGSLKDLIYSSQCLDTWQSKYCFRSKGLAIQQVQMYGRQILEALIYIDERGFPPFTQLHSGNVIVEEQTCRLTGYETSLLGYISKLNPVLRRKLKNNPAAIEQISFGHLLFEMAAGFELDTAHPQPRHLASIEHDGMKEVLLFIFEHQSGEYPDIHQIAQHPFFRHIELREMDSYVPPKKHFPGHVRSLLKVIKRKSKTHKRDKGKPMVHILQIKDETASLNLGSSKKKSKSKESLDSRGSGRKGSTRKGKRSMSADPVPSTAMDKLTSPPPPPAPAVSVKMPSERTALMSDIRQGVKLKKAIQNPYV